MYKSKFQSIKTELNDPIIAIFKNIFFVNEIITFRGSLPRSCHIEEGYSIGIEKRYRKTT